MRVRQPGGKAKNDACLIGHVQPVWDPRKHRHGLDVVLTAADVADPALGQANGRANPHLAGPGPLPSSRNSAPMSRLANARRTSGRAQKPGGTAGGPNALSRISDSFARGLGADPYVGLPRYSGISRR